MSAAKYIVSQAALVVNKPVLSASAEAFLTHLANMKRSRHGSLNMNRTRWLMRCEGLKFDNKELNDFLLELSRKKVGQASRGVADQSLVVKFRFAKNVNKIVFAKNALQTNNVVEYIKQKAAVRAKTPRIALVPNAVNETPYICSLESPKYSVSVKSLGKLSQSDIAKINIWLQNTLTA